MVALSLFSGPKVALCACGEPLVSTLAFSKHEFACVRCGRLYAWLDPRAADETPELVARMEENREAWRPFGEALLSGGIMLTECATCRRDGEPHLSHATDEERAAHEQALERFRALRGARA